MDGLGSNGLGSDGLGSDGLGSDGLGLWTPAIAHFVRAAGMKAQRRRSGLGIGLGIGLGRAPGASPASPRGGRFVHRAPAKCYRHRDENVARIQQSRILVRSRAESPKKAAIAKPFGLSALPAAWSIFVIKIQGVRVFRLMSPVVFSSSRPSANVSLIHPAPTTTGRG